MTKRSRLVPTNRRRSKNLNFEKKKPLRILWFVEQSQRWFELCFVLQCCCLSTYIEHRFVNKRIQNFEFWIFFWKKKTNQQTKLNYKTFTIGFCLVSLIVFGFRPTKPLFLFRNNFKFNSKFSRYLGRLSTCTAHNSIYTIVFNASLLFLCSFNCFLMKKNDLAVKILKILKIVFR